MEKKPQRKSKTKGSVAPSQSSSLEDARERVVIEGVKPE